MLNSHKNLLSMVKAKEIEMNLPLKSAINQDMVHNFMQSVTLCMKWCLYSHQVTNLYNKHFLTIICTKKKTSQKEDPSVYHLRAYRCVVYDIKNFVIDWKVLL